MRVLFYTRSNPFSHTPHGGAETSIRLIAEKLAGRGNEVFYLTDRPSSDSIEKAAATGVTLMAARSMTPKKSKYKLPLTQDLSLIYRITSLTWFCLTRRINIAYCYYESSVLNELLRVQMFLPRLKVVMRMAGKLWYHDCKRSTKTRDAFQKYFDKIDSVNFICRDLARMTEGALQELGMKNRFKHHFILDIGSSAPFYRIQPYIPLNSKGIFQVVMATRFSRVAKRQDILIKALALIPDNLPIHCTFIGEGPEKQSMIELSQELGISKKVTFESFTEQDKLWEILQKSQLLCHSVDYEGLSKIIIESMAQGLPVLASDVTPLNSYIEDGVNGFLALNNPEDWARKITLLMDNPDQLKQASTKGSEYVKMHYDPDVNVQQYEKEFNKIIETKR